MEWSLCFHLALGPTNYVANPEWSSKQIQGWSLLSRTGQGT